MATVTVNGRTVEVPDEKAEAFLEPIEERRRCQLVQGEPVIFRLNESWIRDPEWLKTYGPMFIMGRVNLDEQRVPLYLPNEYSIYLPELIPMRDGPKKSPLEMYQALSEIKWPRKY